MLYKSFPAWCERSPKDNQPGISEYTDAFQPVLLHFQYATSSLTYYQRQLPNSLRKGLQPPYEGPYKVVDRTKKVFRTLRHGKEGSVSIDRLKPAYISKELEDFPVEVNLKEKVSLQSEEIQESEQEKPRESSSRQETTTHSGHTVRFNPKYS
ncbi:hypothetical protein TNIN_157291 [Trichonephila inaurata madagascariensis]|uniref:Uncharacterized protein n=1 Tax=Trichonephila inaurata madagascariensis TaxID=2747483 RepID=A0A8X6YSR6_9ARAC|nr:hypothetical protein TNIN_95171 [Trichonephila inaurata madagascariensis]GFY76380.1 hypothetical protein TNIN_157291 [Trichonephila inaurata madagascariensis]